MNIYILFIFALVPILWLVISMGASLLKAHIATFSVLLITIVLALVIWQMPVINALTAALEGALLGLWPIMIVIISAIFTYKLSVHTKSMDLIKQMLSNISTDRRIQVLVLAWAFGGFLEAISGYGTSVAIPASILIVLGFDPIFAAVICLISNTVPTAFGAAGIAVTTLSAVTGLETQHLSWFIALQLSPFILLMPFILVIITSKSIKGLKGVIGITLVSGLAFVIPQLVAAYFLGEAMPTLLGSLCSLTATILWARIFHKDKCAAASKPIGIRQAIIAWLPYILIFLLIILTSPLFSALSKLLEHVKTSITVYTGQNPGHLNFKWLSSPGTLIFISAIIGGLVQGAKIRDIFRVFIATLKQMTASTITVLSIIAASKVMSYSGMITVIATVLVKATGSFFPLVSPMIGMLGTFITGSDTSSNVLFGALQKEVATSIGANPYWLAASNTAGATAGKMISPQSIAVATSATGLAGYEGKILKSTAKFCVVYVIVLGLIIYFGSRLV
jgi:lactate permease